MEKITKKAWVEQIQKTATALIGSPYGWSLERVKDCLDGLATDAIKYTNGKINAGRSVYKATSKQIEFVLHKDGTHSFLPLTNGNYYTHENASGKYMIAYFPAEYSCVYAVSSTGN